MLNKLELGSSVKRLSFKLDTQWFTIQDLEENSEVMLSNFFRIV